MPPRVSVVMPVYNVAPFIGATIASILNQTFTDFELLIFDDCSTDDTVAIAKTTKDPRIRIIQNTYNLGRAGTDNVALEYVKGEYLAKMDGDDTCYPERFFQQVAYLDKHAEVNVVGSFMQNFGADTYLNRYPADPADAQVLTLFTLPTGNPSMMMRTALFSKYGMRYNESMRQSEDYDFCARYISELRIATIQAPLVNYRVPVQTQKKAILSEREAVSDTVREETLRRWGIPFTHRELQVYNTIAMLGRPLGDISLAEAEAWLLKLIQFNDKQPLFDSVALRRGLGERWFEICYTHSQSGLRSLFYYRRSSLSINNKLTGRQWMLFWIKSLRSIL